MGIVYWQDLDMDSLIMENKYLADRVAQVETEKELVNQTLQNYKSMLENKRKKSNIKLEIADNETIMTQEQVAHLFENKLTLDSAITSAKLLEIKNFVYGVIEALNDRTLALAHQRKANKILASRISDLELKLNPSKNNGTKKKSTPSQIFLQNYNPANADSNFDAMLDEELKKYDKSEKSMPKHENGDSECNGSQNLNGFAKNGEDDLELPPHLDALLKKALDDIKQDKEKDNKDD